MPAFGILPFSALVLRKPDAPGKLYPGQRNVRIHEDIHPHDAPDFPRQGDIPSRFARQQIAITALDRTFGMGAGAEDFLLRAEGPMPFARPLFGAQLSFGQRANIYRNNVDAYGSLFEVVPTTYGIE